jgi:hypothetical protein
MLLTQLMNEYQPQSRATAERVRRSLPRLKVRASTAKGTPLDGEAICKAGEACTVCHEVFAEGDQVMELPCNHSFHDGCILPWLEGHNTCPICRQELPAEERRREPAGSSMHHGGYNASGAQQATSSPRQPHAAAVGSGIEFDNQLFGGFNAMLQSVATSWHQFHHANNSDAQPTWSRAEGGAMGSESSGDSRHAEEWSSAQQERNELRARREEERAAERRANAAAWMGSTGSRHGQRPQDEEGGTTIVTMLVGGVLGAVAGGLLAASLGSSRRR